MSARLRIVRVGPLASVQDAGRFGMLRYGVSASGPMDRTSFARAGAWLGGAGAAGVEFTRSGIDVEATEGALALAWDGGDFAVSLNGAVRSWPGRAVLRAGDRLAVAPGESGNYGYLRFGAEMKLAPVLGSRATNTVSGVGGKPLVAGDELGFGDVVPVRGSTHPRPAEVSDGPIRVVWGLHAEAFPAQTRQRFVTEEFVVSQRLDRMGVALEDAGGVFAGLAALSLVSDAIVPGDIQIVGGGVPTVLMRDHQPTGGYPRFATVISADFDRFAQLRPGSVVRFMPVTVAHAQRLREVR